MVRLFDGHTEWLANLEQLGDDHRRKGSLLVVAHCTECLRENTAQDSPWLCVAPPSKKERLRWMLEKTTELSVQRLVLLESDFSEQHSTPFDKMLAYVIQAAEQSERISLPLFLQAKNDSMLTPLSQFLEAWLLEQENGDCRVKLLVCRERSNSTPVLRALERIHTSKAQNERLSVAYLIGPEGGWSPTEQAKMDELEQRFPCDVMNISLGPTILRAETAAMTAMAAHSLFLDIHNHT
jgi:16S rRNA (uracil1498-N3)-methyltransferase